MVAPCCAPNVDVMFPVRRITALAAAFAERWPDVALQLQTGILGDVVDAVVSGRTVLAISGAPGLPPEIEARPCGSVTLVAVAAPTHPLAAMSGIDSLDLEDHLHLVFSRQQPDADPSLLGVERGLKWRVTDMAVRLDLLRAGLGWARMPSDRVADDLAAGSLVELPVRRWRGRPTTIDFVVGYHRQAPPGPVGTWLVRTLTDDQGS
jgi:DNA-binding transcriptional LysR family regulator